MSIKSKQPLLFLTRAEQVSELFHEIALKINCIMMSAYPRSYLFCRQIYIEGK